MPPTFGGIAAASDIDLAFGDLQARGDFGNKRCQQVLTAFFPFTVRFVRWIGRIVVEMSM
jgi:hypothetical protein